MLTPALLHYSSGVVSFKSLGGMDISYDSLPKYHCGNESLTLRFATTRQTDVFFLTGE